MLGLRLKEVRNRKGLSQGQVAEYAGVSQSTLSDLERGEIAPKTVDALVNLATYFDCSADYLLGLTDDPRRPDRRVVTPEALSVIELVNSLPAEQRIAAVAVLQAAIELVKVGERQHQQTLPEPVSARQGGGVTKTGFAELGPQQKMSTGNEAAGDDSAHRDTARKDELLALLKKMLSPEDFEYVQRLVDAGLPLTEADINRLLQSGGHQSFEQGFELPDDEGTIS